MTQERVTSVYDLPKELLDTIPVLESGKTATFRSLKSVVDMHPVTGEEDTLYPTLHIGYRDTIKYNGKTYIIGIPKEIKEGNIVAFKMDLFGAGEIFNGKFSFTGGNIEEEEKYLFCMLSNIRKGNPNRSLSIEPTIELIDEAAESKANRKRRNSLAEALMIANQMNLNEVKEWVAALNMDEKQDESVLRDIIEGYAEENPELFLENHEDPAFKLKTTIRRAVDKNIIAYDYVTGRVKWTDAKGTTIVTIDENGREDWLLSFATYCITSKAGEATLTGIKKRIKDSIITEAVKN